MKTQCQEIQNTSRRNFVRIKCFNLMKFEDLAYKIYQQQLLFLYEILIMNSNTATEK
jgi:hypothetical protein